MAEVLSCHPNWSTATPGDVLEIVKLKGKVQHVCEVGHLLKCQVFAFLELSTPSYAVWLTVLSQSPGHPRVTACYFFLPSTLLSVQSLWVLTCANVCPDRNKTHTPSIPHKLLLVGVVL